MKAAEITAVVLTRNEEGNIAHALRSLPEAVARLVVDARSSDATAQIARANGARVIERDWKGFVDARTFALGYVATPWTLMLDADENLDSALRAAIAGADGRADGYLVRRDTFFCGKPVRMWRNEPLLRLFRTDRARLQAVPVAGGEAELHERWIVEGSVVELPGRLLHHSYPNLAAYRTKYAAYTAIEARGVRATRAALGRATVIGALRFLWNLVRRGALLDGWRGIYVAYCSAMYERAVLREALREREAVSA